MPSTKSAELQHLEAKKQRDAYLAIINALFIAGLVDVAVTAFTFLYEMTSKGKEADYNLAIAFLMGLGIDVVSIAVTSVLASFATQKFYKTDLDLLDKSKADPLTPSI